MKQSSQGAAEAPTSFDGLRDQLLARREELPKRLAQVAAFAIENPDEVALSTAAALAVRAHVQPSTLVRFAQTFGYAGFADMQAVFRDRLRDRAPSYAARLEALSSASESAVAAGALFDGFADAAEHSLDALRTRLSPAGLDEAVRILAAAETIYLIGQRRSFAVTAYLNYLLGSLGVKNILVSSALGTDLETVGFATPKDAALAVSFAPYAPTTIEAAERIADAGAKLVAITDSPFSPLLAKARCAIEVVESDFNGFRAMSATMALSVTLAVAIARARRELARLSFDQPC